MKKLNQLLERISYTCIQGSIDTEVTDIVNDSRKITPGCLFFCIPGAVTDGHFTPAGTPPGKSPPSPDGTYGPPAPVSSEDRPR